MLVYIVIYLHMGSGVMTDNFKISHIYGHLDLLLRYSFSKTLPNCLGTNHTPRLHRAEYSAAALLSSRFEHVVIFLFQPQSTQRRLEGAHHLDVQWLDRRDAVCWNRA